MKFGYIWVQYEFRISFIAQPPAPVNLSITQGGVIGLDGWRNNWRPISKHIKYTAKEPWWRHQMETFSSLLAFCAGNSPVPGEFHAQRPVTRSLDVTFDLRLNKRLSKQ